jgi:hypothetical protein
VDGDGAFGIRGGLCGLDFDELNFGGFYKHGKKRCAYVSFRDGRLRCA